MRALIGVLKKLDGGIASAELVIAVIAIIAMLLLVIVQIPLRLMPLDTRVKIIEDFSWMTSVAKFLLLWSTLAGASLATRGRRHILIDVVTKALPKRTAVGVNVIAATVAALLCAFIAYVAQYVVRSNWGDQTVLRGVNLGPVQIIIPIAFGIMAFRFVVIALEDLRGVTTGDLAYLKAYEHDPAQEIQAAHGERISADAEVDGIRAPDQPETKPPGEGPAT